MKAILAFFSVLLISISGMAVNYCGGSIKGGDGRPWPWGEEVRLPWKVVQGVWQTVSGDCRNQFIFKVTNIGGETVVRITQYDPYSCKVVGTGAGYLDDRVIVAQMTQSGITYNMSIHGFNESDLLDGEDGYKNANGVGLQTLKTNGRVLKVINLFPVGKWHDRSTYEIAKIDTATVMICQ